ncbi:AraC family transcriptional regulator (plasmid) [Ensifer adhaerens]|uniref:helix-turn-helix domain-containing protein n=1 Tax=Ensifer adhaerens TaxID=106592 RepID=UPI0023AA0148|nr:AraC family transcriptional regulator [Ensifer adhaerens]WDZ80616.1 AraC family transcriptional regulator [Ensifer adhaerens]
MAWRYEVPQHSNAADGYADDLYVEKLTLAFLLRLSGPERCRPERQIRTGLANYQLRRITEYLCAHLSEGTNLRELASIVGLSRLYFSSGFRQSTGMPVHQWLMQKRISKAKDYLVATECPVAQIALVLGVSTRFILPGHSTRPSG